MNKSPVEKIDGVIMNYNEFLQSKNVGCKSTGFNVDDKFLIDYLFDFQRDIVKWAIKKGKAAIFGDCGLGKTIMQLEWANHIHAFSNRPV